MSDRLMGSDPKTEAGRRLLADWRRDPKELWTVQQVSEAIRAIEEEACAIEGPDRCVHGRTQPHSTAGLMPAGDGHCSGPGSYWPARLVSPADREGWRAKTRDLVGRFISTLIENPYPTQRVRDYGNDILRLLDDAPLGQREDAPLDARQVPLFTLAEVIEALEAVDAFAATRSTSTRESTAGALGLRDAVGIIVGELHTAHPSLDFAAWANRRGRETETEGESKP